MVGVGDAAGHDALHALVPALTRYDHRAATVVGGLGCGKGGLGELRLYLAARVVDLLKAGRQDGGLGGVVGVEQVEGHVGGTHAPRRVEARHQREGQGVSRDLRDVHARRGRKRHDAWARGAPHVRDAVGHQRAVLALQQHHVGDGPEHGHLGVATPQLGLAQAVAQHVDELEGNAGTSQLARGALGPELRVGYGNALRNEVARLVVVGDHHVEALLQQPFHLARGGDAVVDGHH